MFSNAKDNLTLERVHSYLADIKHEDGVAAAAEKLCEIAKTGDKGREMLLQAKAIPTLCAVLNRKKTSPVNRRNAGVAVALIVPGGQRYLEAVLLSKPLPGLLTVLQHKDTTDAQKLSIVVALKAICAVNGPEEKNALVQAKALPALVKTIGSRNNEVALGALALLNSIAVSSDDNTEALVSAKVHESLRGCIVGDRPQAVRKAAALTLGSICACSDHHARMVYALLTGCPHIHM